jgi:ABC-type dipeptide/oligopeptide/nickel transport system ATPase subunit
MLLGGSELRQVATLPMASDEAARGALAGPRSVQASGGALLHEPAPQISASCAAQTKTTGQPSIAQAATLPPSSTSLNFCNLSVRPSGANGRVPPRALLLKPSLLILDEATDWQNQSLIAKSIDALRGSMTVLTIVTALDDRFADWS